MCIYAFKTNLIEVWDRKKKNTKKNVTLISNRFKCYLTL